MNTKWLKDHVLLLGLLAAFIVVVGGLVWLQQNAAARVQEIDNSLAEQISQLNHLREMKPPPTRENIDVVKQNRQQLEQLYSDLLAVVSRSQIQTQEFVRPVGFLQLMASRFARLRQNAEKAKVKLPEGFAFGFSRYAGPPPTLPARGLSEAETTNVLIQLTKQMAAIEKLSDLLIQSRPDEISQIRRAEVEPGSVSAEAMETVESTGPKGLYETLPFEFRFVGTTDSLRMFLNNLSQSDWFFAVRSVQVAGEQPAAPTGAGETATPAPASAPKRAVLNLAVRVDLIEFPQQPVSKPKT